MALAEGIRRRVGSTLGVGITGVAGPGGGSEEKPVGTVHVAVSHAGGVKERGARFPGERENIRWQASQAALDMVRVHFLYNGQNAAKSAIEKGLSRALVRCAGDSLCGARRNLAALMNDLRALETEISRKKAALDAARKSSRDAKICRQRRTGKTGRDSTLLSRVTFRTAGGHCAFAG